MRNAAVLAATVTLIAGLALAGAGPHQLQVEQGWLLAIALIVAVKLARDLAPRSAGPAARLFRRRSEAREPLPDPLQEIVTLVEMGLSGEFELHHRTRPLLVETAAGTLHLKRGIDLARDPQAAAAALGPAAWELLRPDRPEPPERGTRGDAAASIRSVLEALESL